MLVPDFINKALGVPFVVGGRDFDGWDCWGLVFCAYRELFGVELNRLDRRYDASVSYAGMHQVIGIEKVGWVEVLKPDFGDVGLYRVGRYETHVSLVLNRLDMLHCEDGAGTISERLTSSVWGQRNVGYFRRATAG